MGADITYIAVQTAFASLSAIINFFTRRIVGYVISLSVDAAFHREAHWIAPLMRESSKEIIKHSY
jgi:transposase InsO family protein